MGEDIEETYLQQTIDGAQWKLIRLLEGLEIKGKITGKSDHALLVIKYCDNQPMLVYKTAISTIQ